MATKRDVPKRTMTREQADREREARVYDALGKFCKLSPGIESMTISVGDESVTIDRDNTKRMQANAKDISRRLRQAR